ncbi:MAG: hypothetical protein ABI591_15540 [Kofleriaceae bacterium]
MLKVDKTLVFTSWVVVEPAEDIEGLWVSHALEFDVIAQGNSPTEAIEAVREASVMMIVDDLSNELDPHDRRAPAEYFDRLAKVLKHGSQVKISEVSTRVILATQVTWVMERMIHANHEFTQFDVPPTTAHVEQLVAA